VTDHYDVIIVGSGAGGGTLAHTLAPSGKRIPILERGDFLTRETGNWNPEPVVVDGKYISKDTQYDADGTPFQPQVRHFIGGATKHPALTATANAIQIDEHLLPRMSG
jgi:choline dehydrogenase-like flavoprotein